MNKLIIVGNGFDLAHGLKTAYVDFLKHIFIKNWTEALNTTEGKSSDGLITIKISNYLQKEYDLNKLNENHSLKQLLLELKKSSVNIKYNSRLFQEMVENFSNYGWVDLEKYYYDKLKNGISTGPTSHEIKTLNFEFEKIKKELIEYLKIAQNQYKLIPKIEKLEQEYLKIFQKSKQNNEYLTVMLLESPNNIYKKVHVLNFNYTNVISNYLKKLHNNDYLEYAIHGSLKDPNSIIFGFGDEHDDHYSQIEKLNNNEYFRFIKSFDYFKTGTYQKLMNFIESDDFDIFILGHSLGVSDRTMFRQIFHSPKLNMVKIYYHQKTKNENDNDFKNLTYELSRHFEKKGEMRLKILPFDESEPMPQFKE